MKGVLVQFFTFSQDTQLVSGHMWLSGFWKTARVSEWLASDHGCSASGTSSFRQQRCVVSPPIDTAELRRTPHPALVLRAMPQFMGPYPIFYPKYSSKLCFHICSSIFVLWLLSCIHTRPRCIDCKQQGCIVWGILAACARDNTKQKTEETLDPLWLLLSLLWISSFVWMSTGMKVWKLLFEEKEKLVWFHKAKYSGWELQENFTKGFGSISSRERSKYSIDQPAIKSLAENSDKHNHQSL